jgi:hypothetical protein
MNGSTSQAIRPGKNGYFGRLQKIHLALAIAEGESIAAWAQQNGVSERTAFSWAKDPKVRREVEACRRRVVNQAIGRLTGMARNAVDGIAHLGKGADSESVQLRAWRAILADMMSVAPDLQDLKPQFAGSGTLCEIQDADLHRIRRSH